MYQFIVELHKLVQLFLTGRLITMLAGEGHKEDLEAILEAGIDVYSGLGLLDTTPLPTVRVAINLHF